MAFSQGPALVRAIAGHCRVVGQYGKAAAPARPQTASCAGEKVPKAPPGDTTTTAPRFELQASRHVAAFLTDQGASIAITTYQAGKLLLLGTKPDRSLSVFERSLPRCMGLAASPGQLDIATLSQLWQFRDALGGEPGGGKYAGHDALHARARGGSPAIATSTTSSSAPTAGRSLPTPSSPASPPSPRTRASSRSGSRAASAGWRRRIAAT